MTDPAREVPPDAAWSVTPAGAPAAGGGHPPPAPGPYDGGPRYGQQVHGPQRYGPSVAPWPLHPQERTWAMLAHLAPFGGTVVGFPVLGALVVYLAHKDRSPFVRRHAAASLNFQITLLLVALVGAVLGFVLLIVTLGLALVLLVPLLAVLVVAPIVLQVVAAVAASSGREFSYPLTPTFVR